ncbi:MAG: hypothetical protein K5898_13170 [Ruminococcus sp.]|uniref:hypothetical protein n=1 Tax=Ruminococcus sp. TaxID=41978 RepID=UPI0025EF6749|nr:hypothetical protein [Ruminococcus sp.]MCR4796090.1 hypothetical protein [Ruminococcus sp.]
MNGSTSIDTIINYLPERIRELLKAIPIEKMENIMELRLRGGGPVYLVYSDRICYLSQRGELTEMLTDSLFTASGAHIRDIIDRLCHYSMHSCAKQLREGFFVVENGVRVGVSGTYSTGDSAILTDFTSVNFRVSRCVQGCADDIFSKTYGKNVIICGGVSSGKTTVLRELCRLTGSFRKSTLIDERNEISCLIRGIPQNDVGSLTDVISGSPRSVGIMSAIRTLSPDVIFCDEIASQEDVEAILDGIGCGVVFTVTAHGTNYTDLLRRKEIAYLIEKGRFDLAVFLKGASFPGEVREIRRLKYVDQA